MSWFSGLGSAVTGVLSRGLDLLLSRLIRLQGGLQGVELEIQRRVPDISAPAQAALLGHISQVANAAALIEAEPSQVFDDLEQIALNPFLSGRIEPGDRFLYSGDMVQVFTPDMPVKKIRVDIASPIPLSKDELKTIASGEIERRVNESPDTQIVAADVDPAWYQTLVVDFNLSGAVRVY